MRTSYFLFLLVLIAPSFVMAAEDAYEPNDTQGTAYDLSSHENTWLADITGLGAAYDDDWYKIK